MCMLDAVWMHHVYCIMVTDRIMEKKTFNLDRRRLRPIFP